MAFMQRQITCLTEWVEVDTSHGIWFFPIDIAPQSVVDFTKAVRDGLADPEDFPGEVAVDVLPSTDAFGVEQIHSVQAVFGHGVRLSAPGYLDCTEWSVFDTEEEAVEYLDEMYGDIEEEAP